MVQAADRRPVPIEFAGPILAFFHGPEWRATERSILIGNVAGAAVRFMQFGVDPVVVAVIAGSIQRGPFHADIFASGKI